MGFAVRRVEYRNFRSYESFTLSDIGDLTIIVGPNAVGKTNLIEGIQLTTAFHSFRSPKPHHLLAEGAKAGGIRLAAEDGERRAEVELVLTSDSRTYRYNGKARRASSLQGIIPSVLFCPDDLELVKGPQSLRRLQVDRLGCQLSANYRAVRRDYERVVRQKNRCLKDGASAAYLESLNEVVVAVGAQLYRLRLQLVEALAPCVSSAYAGLSQERERISVGYFPSWFSPVSDQERETDFDPLSLDEARAALARGLESRFAEERVRRTSLIGPHADRIEFYVNGRNARQFASQGQQRSLVLSCKMAEVELFRDRLGVTPVLLLDDVMSELDEVRRAALLDLVSGGVQTFVTATSMDYFAPCVEEAARVVRLERGDRA